MAIESLSNGKGKQPVASTSKAAPSKSTEPSLSTRISQLAASLPPAAPASASLNPLADLIELYTAIPLTVAESASTKAQEVNRQQVHTALHSIKGVFEHLIKHGRLHGVLKTAKKVKAGDGTGIKAREDETVQRVKEWLKARWEEYLAHTAKVVSAHWDSGVRVRAILRSLGSSRPCSPRGHAALGPERAHVARQDGIALPDLARPRTASQVRRGDSRSRCPGTPHARKRDGRGR